ncbi:MAG: hypothetical protein H6953_15830 [Chromatiaceae bacterium]|nr:hypothetical protein [Gammaproteobacteria bacterium]MCP5306914.1 hypothetical protein [Chromatiaceae bacterium]
MPAGKPIGVSTAESPDLDWSQVSETVRMLNLAVAQISMAMHEGEDSVGSLTHSFTHMVDSVEQISQTMLTLDDAGEGTQAVQSTVLAHCDEVRGGIQQSIVAFQFYDRLSQRLDHVRYALDALAELVADRGRLFSPEEWTGLQKTICSRYTMREEQEMFEALLKGASIEEALDIVREKIHGGDIDDIELF